MTFFGLIFYVLAAVTVTSTLLAISQRQVLHGVIYVIISFIATGLLFYLLGAPFLAAIEIIIYAGAIMVLFLFAVMTVKVDPNEKERERLQWLPAIILSLISLSVGAILIFETPGSPEGLKPAMVTPAAFGHYLFKTYWLPVEIASFLLLIGLVGALYLGGHEPKEEGETLEAKR